MGSPRVTSPPSIHVHDSNDSHGPTSPISPVRASIRSITRNMPRGHRPMTIPTSMSETTAPPPLPPPRYIDDLAAGSDPGYQWANHVFDNGNGKAKGAVAATSSLRGNWGGRMDSREERDTERTRWTGSRAGHSEAGVGARAQEVPKHPDEGYYSLSGSSFVNYQLHGERNLQQENIVQSSRTYDNKMLSKIGRPKTPSRSPSTLSAEASPTSSVSFPHPRGPHPLKSLSISEGMQGAAHDAHIKSESAHSDYSDSPYKMRSPSHLSSTASSTSFGDLRSPKFDWNISTPAPDLDPSHPRHYSVGDVPWSHRVQTSGSNSISSARSGVPGRGFDERAGGQSGSGGRSAGRIKREHPDQSFQGETNLAVDLSVDETNTSCALRQLHLDDRLPYQSLETPSLSTLPSFQNLQMQGIKRRAESPPTEAHHGEKFPFVVGTTNEQFQRSASSHLQPNHHPGSPMNRHAQLPQGSISSNSSAGFKNGSFASSGISLGASSMTSYSSPGRLSPSGVSPTTDYQQTPPASQYPAQISMNPTQADPYAHTPQRAPTDTPYPQTPGSRKMSVPTSASRKRSTPNLPGSLHMCKCCLKKPKKFNTLEELQQHEAEKAYECQYCHNKFKNKNEMERHQNSLHLRRHSWSCASIADQFQVVFHSSTAIPPTPSNPSGTAHPDAPAPTDVCGYCGEEFTNEPPDWQARMAHLTNQHKFGECNQSKKFYRADHFRQHLKHSHAGTAGKWTNMLEQACMRDEPPDPLVAMAQAQQQQQQQQQPVMQQLGMQMNMQQQPMQPQATAQQMGMPLSTKQDQQQGIPSRGVPMANMNMAVGMGMDSNNYNNINPRIAALGMQAMSGGAIQQDRIDELPEDQHHEYQEPMGVKGEEEGLQ